MSEEPALGLEEGRTIVKAYDPRWASEGENEVARVRSALAGAAADIDHVGSTAVPGLAAKPIIDIAVAHADPADTLEVQAALESLGYVFHNDQGDEGGLLFVKGSESHRTHHLHVVAKDSEQWKNYLAFRDALRSDRRLRTAYAAVKERLAVRFADDRLAYLDEKSGFVEDALRVLRS